MPAVASDYLTIPVRFDPDSGQTGDITLANIVAAFTAAGIPHSVEINNGFRHPKTNELLHANLKVHKDYVDQANAILATMFGVFQKGPPMPNPLWGAVVSDLRATVVTSGGDGNPGDNVSNMGQLRYRLLPVSDRFADGNTSYMGGILAINAPSSPVLPVPGTTVLPNNYPASYTNPGLPMFALGILMDTLYTLNATGQTTTNKVYLKATLNFNLDGKAKTIETPKFPLIVDYGSLYEDIVNYWFYVSDKLDLYEALGDPSNSTSLALGDHGLLAGTTQADLDTWKKLWVPRPSRSYEEAVAAGKWVDEV